MNILYACLGLLLVVDSFGLNPYKAEWETFKLNYNRKYKSATEEQERMQIFLKNKEKVTAHNALYEKGLVTYFMGINKFSDKFPDEIAKLTGYKVNDVKNTPEDHTMFSDINIYSDVPDSIDWREKGAVTPVKDQEYCGSCWAFSATGALEGQHFLKTKKLVSLSEQNLVDCSGAYGNDGCEGGFMMDAYNYVKANGGIDTEKSYPYLGKDGKCNYKAKNSGSNCTGFVNVTLGDENEMKVVVAEKGPLSVAIEATDNFQFYLGGIFYDDTCHNVVSKLNHGVLVVGYGTQNGTDYWIVKNSWGEGFGMKGYILMSRNKKNNCGIAFDAKYPLV